MDLNFLKSIQNFEKLTKSILRLALSSALVSVTIFALVGTIREVVYKRADFPISVSLEQPPENSQPAPQINVRVASPPPPAQPQWTGIDLWSALNNRRKETGLPEVQLAQILCTIASERLNNQLDRGDVSHDGFNEVLEKYRDKVLNEGFASVQEFLTLGYPTPEEAVTGWENTLGHSTALKEVFSGGCAYAQDSYGVLITAQ